MAFMIKWARIGTGKHFNFSEDQAMRTVGIVSRIVNSLVKPRHSRGFCIGMIVAAAIGLAATGARAAVITNLDDAAHGAVFDLNGSGNGYSTSTYMNVGTSKSGATSYRYRTVVSFDLSTLPAGTIQSATFKIYHGSNTGTPSASAMVYHVDSPAGTAVAASDYQAAATQVSGSTITVSPTFHYYSFDVTSFIQADASTSNKITKFLVEIPGLAVPSSDGQNLLSFSENGTTNPLVLSVTTAVPSPSSLGLLGGGGILALLLGRGTERRLLGGTER
jgi:hypothetical protein